MKEWWLNCLSVTDRTNIVGFAICMVTSILGTALVTKMKLPVWKLQVAVILLIDLLALALLVFRITCGR